MKMYACFFLLFLVTIGAISTAYGQPNVPAQPPLAERWYCDLEYKYFGMELIEVIASKSRYQKDDKWKPEGCADKSDTHQKPEYRLVNSAYITYANIYDNRTERNIYQKYKIRWRSGIVTTPAEVCKAVKAAGRYVSLVTMPEEYRRMNPDDHYNVFTVSRPRELPPQPLLEPDVKLSLHPAPIKQMNLVFLFSSAQIGKAASQTSLSDIDMLSPYCI